MKLHFQKIGLRNLKSALAVFLCMFLFEIFTDESPFYACIAAVICMGDTVENSVVMGKNRIIGTFLGGAIGALFMFLGTHLPIFLIPNSILTAIGIIIAIYSCNVIDKPGSVTICCIVFIGIMLSYQGVASYHYAISRCIATSIGIIIAILVNKYITPPKES